MDINPIITANERNHDVNDETIITKWNQWDGRYKFPNVTLRNTLADERDIPKARQQPARGDLGGDLGRDIGRLPRVEPRIEEEETGSNTAIIRKGETKSRSSDLCRYREWQLADAICTLSTGSPAGLTAEEHSDSEGPCCTAPARLSWCAQRVGSTVPN
ncbi:hypothetical protein H920_12948 [Fukomys damarensis]|uniref:Uncharacterized protein n=1 Tax=Fukomys damarensis TaxID=885580 RepID=A0A091D0Q2_FUKDA|nr:hypothetical protein H920_12948 [Fukomys damarensis]